ncbi:hypothetical protein FPV67DRAFT_1450132 [Lyophyllum atratum]|nr:hypothetical protein FPV67DRAFT_1450132 [Lyophyllum atratum]
MPGPYKTVSDLQSGDPAYSSSLLVDSNDESDSESPLDSTQASESTNQLVRTRRLEPSLEVDAIHREYQEGVTPSPPSVLTPVSLIGSPPTRLSSDEKHRRRGHPANLDHLSHVKRKLWPAQPNLPDQNHPQDLGDLELGHLELGLNAVNTSTAIRRELISQVPLSEGGMRHFRMMFVLCLAIHAHWVHEVDKYKAEIDKRREAGGNWLKYVELLHEVTRTQLEIAAAVREDMEKKFAVYGIPVNRKATDFYARNITWVDDLGKNGLRFPTEPAVWSTPSDEA